MIAEELVSFAGNRSDSNRLLEASSAEGEDLLVSPVEPIRSFSARIGQRQQSHVAGSPDAAGGYGSLDLIAERVSIRLRGTRSNRFGLGARIRLTGRGHDQIREINGGNGYSGQSAKRAHFGLGSSRKVDSVEVRWPSGIIDTIKVSVNKHYVVEEGNGIATESEEPRR